MTAVSSLPEGCLEDSRGNNCRAPNPNPYPHPLKTLNSFLPHYDLATFWCHGLLHFAEEETTAGELKGLN